MLWSKTEDSVWLSRFTALSFRKEFPTGFETGTPILHSCLEKLCRSRQVSKRTWRDKVNIERFVSIIQNYMFELCYV